MLIHGASGGVGSRMLQLAKLAEIEMFGTCSVQGAAVVRELGASPAATIPRRAAERRPSGDLRVPVEDAWGRMASGSEGRYPYRESAR